MLSGAGLESTRLFSSVRSDEASSWQTTLDELVDIDTPCDTRREKLISLVSKSQDIIGDVSSVIGSACSIQKTSFIFSFRYFSSLPMLLT